MKKLSSNQKSILWNLDGFIDSVDVEGTSHAAVKGLHAMGLVSYRRKEVRNYPATPGGMVWHKWVDSTRIVYEVKLTQAGSDFIYNGGLDNA